MRRWRYVGDGLLILLLVLLACAAIAQLQHNLTAGPHGHAPHDRPVATRGAPRP